MLIQGRNRSLAFSFEVSLTLKSYSHISFAWFFSFICHPNLGEGCEYNITVGNLEFSAQHFLLPGFGASPGITSDFAKACSYVPNTALVPN